MLSKTLQKLGLNEKEIKIYLALLPLGAVLASTLAKKTGIPKSTTTYTCLQLVKKGLITKTQKDNYFIFTANYPDRILLLLENEKRRIQEKEKEAQNLVSELQRIFNPATKLPKVRFFEGPEQIITMLEEVLQFDTELFVAAKLDTDFHPDISHYLTTRYDPERLKKKSATYLLYNDNEATTKYRLQETRKNAYTLLVPQEKFPFNATCHIYQKRVVFYSLSRYDMTGIIIENENVFSMHHSLFKLAWNEARKLPINSAQQVPAL